jgi:hypothetical protein
MKRYTITAIGAICDADYEYAKEANNGAWVFYEDVKNEFDKYRIEHSICEDTVEELQEINKELLEALEYYLPLLENCNRYGPEGDAARDALAGDIGLKARSAIAKATGD